MRVLVTGGCGFAGSHVCEHYKAHGAAVRAFDNLTKYELKRTGYASGAARHHNLDVLTRMGVKVVKEDIRDKAAVEHAVKRSDFVIHTAAQPAMTIGWEDPELDFQSNVAGTFNILEAARKYKVPTV
jgi:CDP-paratose 2-epimerase